MIKNILFDMGNVLIRFDREYFIDRLGVALEDKPLLMREVFLSVEWVQMDRGTLREETAEPLMCQRLPEHLHSAVHSLVSLWDEPMLPVAGMAEDEALVFVIHEEEDSEESSLAIVTEDDVVDRVFDEYYDLLKEEGVDVD